MDDDDISSGYIYVVRLQERRRIVVLGSVKDQSLEARMRRYPEGSLLLSVVSTPLAVTDAAGAALISAANEMFVPHPEFGIEYFECDRISDVLALFHKVTIGFVTAEFDDDDGPLERR
jgi:hypothetical protein